MNIVSLSLCYPSEANPHAGTFIQQRLSALAGHQCTVRVVHPIPTPVWSNRRRRIRMADRPLPTWHIPMPYFPGIGALTGLNPYFYARAVYPLLSTLDEEHSIDVIDAHFCWPDGVAAARLARRLHRPYVITLRGLLHRYTRNAATRSSVLRALHGAAAVIAVSESLQRQAAALGIPQEKIHVIPNGVDADVFGPADRRAARKALGRHDDERILITVGHLCRRKGMHRVLRVLPELLERYSALHYVIVGADGAEGQFGSKLERQIRRLGLQDKVTFTGALQRSDVAGWLHAADLFVLPTGNEGYCNALCEALATGLPVVCTDVGGNREIITPANGLLVPFGDDRALVNAIDVTLNSNLDRPAIAHAACRRDWSHVARETATVLQNAAHQTSEAHGSQSVGHTRTTPLAPINR